MLAIDFGARSIKAVQLTRSVSGYRLDNFGMVLTPPESIIHGEIKDVNAVTHALNKMLRKKGFHSKNANLAITGQKVIVREITTPLMDDRELQEGLQWEAPKYVPYDLKESLLDAKKIEELEEKEGNKMMKVLLVAAPRSLINQQIEILKVLKLQPKVVDIVANAQMRTFESYLTPVSSNEEDGNKIDIILSMGASTTEITLIEGDRLKFTRTILKGGNDITRMIAEKYDMPFNEAEMIKRNTGINIPDSQTEDSNNDKEMSEEEKESFEKEKEIADLVNKGVHDIFNEVRKSLNYYKTQYQKVTYNNIILCGGMASMQNIGQALKQQFGITVIMANPLKGIAVNDNIRNIERLEKYKRSLSTVIGLAKRER